VISVGPDTRAMILSLYAKTGEWCETAKRIFTREGKIKVPELLQREADALRKRFIAGGHGWDGGRFPPDGKGR
jgi:hypothetical protein